MNEKEATVRISNRMSAKDRRDNLIDIALELLREGGFGNLTIGAVATQANLTRTLIYKHFTNSQDLINATYRREAAQLDSQIRDEVSRAHGFEAQIRAFAHAIMNAIKTHGWIFGPLEQKTRSPDFQYEQKRRDSSTIRAFGQLASIEFNIPLRKATSAMGMLLSGITSLRIQAHLSTSADDRRLLEELYAELVIGALSSIGKPTAGPEQTL